MSSEISVSLGNLPSEPNSFVGRERDLTELVRLLGQVRALTLCGPGGIGKTRLAVRLACETVTDFPDGAWLVELADTLDPALVVRQLAAGLGITEEPDRKLSQTLADALRPRRLLLILDTCEHVVAAVARLVQQLLSDCPRLSVVGTSREPLRVRGETVWRVPPLEVPAADDDGDPASLQRYAAIRLFAERAVAVRPTFTLDAGNAAAVARLCRTLDGIPLAIELAAARVGALSVDQIAARVSDRFQLLASGDRTAPPRQQTLRAAVDWSYEQLSAAERTLLRRLAVFAGWNLEMAELVCSDEEIPAGRVLDLLAALIDKSLVTLEAELSGDARYRLLDTIREYAAGRLAESGEEPALQLRHRDYMLSLVEGVVAKAFLRGDPPWPARVAMYRRIAAEHANYRAALAVCLGRGDLAEGLRFCYGLRSMWVSLGDVGEGIGWMDRFLALHGEVPDRILARALVVRGDLAFEEQDYPAAGERARQALDLCRRVGEPEAAALRVLAQVSLREGHSDDALADAEAAIAAAIAAGDDWEHGLALAVRAAINARQGRLNQARRSYELALELLRDNNGWGLAQTLYGLGGVARARQDNPAALSHFRQALAIYRQIDAKAEIARCQAGIGWVALTQHDLDLARTSLTESLQLSLATGQRLAIARGLEAFAVLGVAEGRPVRAARLEGAALALREAVGQVPSSPARARLGDLLESARRAVGGPAADALLAAGAAMSADEAVALATGSRSASAPELPDDAASPQASPHAGVAVPSALTAREREIATLIARGLSNRGIADELVISPATVARHVANILGKLGFTSRAQVAAWAAEREPGSRGGLR
jgi:predicted ATPase/DNA-binding CsgD family transcriptional regulator/Tfp pilus assembly protein PilF